MAIQEYFIPCRFRDQEEKLCNYNNLDKKISSFSCLKCPVPVYERLDVPHSWQEVFKKTHEKPTLNIHLIIKR